MRKLELVEIPSDVDLRPICHCIDKIDGLSLNECPITNEIVEEMVGRIGKRNEAVKYSIDYVPDRSIRGLGRFTRDRLQTS